MKKTDNPALNKLLANQEALAQGQSVAEKLRSLIADRQSAIEAAESALPRLDDLAKAREDLLVAVAMGEEKADVVAKFDRDREAERESCRKAWDSFMGVEEDVDQLISGLQRKLDEVEKRVVALQAERNELTRALLLDCATRTGAEYLAAAQKAYECYVRLLGLDRLAQRHGLSINIVRFNHEFVLPSFALPGIEGGGKTVGLGALFDQWKVNYGTEIEDSSFAIDSELREAGVQF